MPRRSHPLRYSAFDLISPFQYVPEVSATLGLIDFSSMGLKFSRWVLRESLPASILSRFDCPLVFCSQFKNVIFDLCT